MTFVADMSVKMAAKTSVVVNYCDARHSPTTTLNALTIDVKHSSHLVSSEQVERRTSDVDNHVLLDLSSCFHDNVIELRPGTIRLQSHLQQHTALHCTHAL